VEVLGFRETALGIAIPLTGATVLISSTTELAIPQTSIALEVAAEASMIDINISSPPEGPVATLELIRETTISGPEASKPSIKMCNVDRIPRYKEIVGDLERVPDDGIVRLPITKAILEKHTQDAGDDFVHETQSFIQNIGASQTHGISIKIIDIGFPFADGADGQMQITG
jgi:hypothetical protein